MLTPAVSQRVRPLFNPATIAWVSFMPLGHRLRRGEGLLLAVNLSITLVSLPTLTTFVIQAAVSTVVLSLLYALNDVYDAPRDVHDHGKDQSFVQFCVGHRHRLLWILGLADVAVVLAAYLVLGPRSAAAVGGVLFVNIAYSAYFKGRAVADVPWVILWGALYTMVPGVELPWTIFAMTGVMTGVAHVFQITRDAPVDTLNKVRTSAVALPWLPAVELAGCCVAMGLILGHHLGTWAGVSAAVPLFLHLTMTSNQVAWLTAKAYYGVVWLLLLGCVYGT